MHNTQAELENLGHIPGVDSTFLTPSTPPTLTPSHAHTISTFTTNQTLTIQDVEGEQERGTMKEEVEKDQEGDRTDQNTVLPIVPPSNLQSTCVMFP